MNDLSFNRVEVNLGAIRHNYSALRRAAGDDVQLMAMVKADAYGHGMIRVAHALAEAGCMTYGVAEMREGVVLRQAGVRGNIFVTMGFPLEAVDLLFTHNLIPVVYSFATARVLSQRAEELGRKIAVHVKVDSGMSRLGILPDQVAEFCVQLETLPGLQIAGLMSHFPEADNPRAESTIQGFTSFAGACGEIKKRGGVLCHIANSGAILNFPATSCDMVRAGIALYGYNPAGIAEMADTVSGRLLPALSFTTTILQVKTLPAGVGVSYGHTYRTRRETRLAVLPVGYEDGYSRALSNRGQVLVHGRKVPVCGRVCMNMCMVDVTGMDGVKEGDPVVLLGNQGDETITADDLAGWMGSISYEVLCLIGNNNNREYFE